MEKEGTPKNCIFFNKNGFCSKKECQFLHEDCIQFNNTQTCPIQNQGKTCYYFHRKMCINWRNTGSCDKEKCTYLHKDCENYDANGYCRYGIDCHFFHRNKNLITHVDKTLDIFKKKCISCHKLKLMVFLDCGDDCCCIECARGLLASSKKCPSCKENVNAFIR